MAEIVGKLATVITVSDRRSLDPSGDLSGPVVKAALEHLGLKVAPVLIVPDEKPQIQRAILHAAEASDLVVTTGGTGFSPRDVTPEATAPLLEKRADGLCELMRLRGLEHTEFAHLSRAVAGIRGSALIVNLPGSPKAAAQCLEAIAHLIGPILDALGGEECRAHGA